MPRSSTRPTPEGADGLAELFDCIDHVGVAVPDLDAAIDFYTKVLGHRLVHRETNAAQGVSEAMLASAATSSATTDRDPAQVQLLAPLTPDSTIAKFLARSGPGLQQLAYRVGDIEQVSELLRRRGLRLLYEEPRRGTLNSLVNFIHPKDTGGVLIELVQPASETTAEL